MDVDDDDGRVVGVAIKKCNSAIPRTIVYLAVPGVSAVNKSFLNERVFVAVLSPHLFSFPSTSSSTLSSDSREHS